MTFLLYSVFILAPILVSGFKLEGCQDESWTQSPKTGLCYKILYPSVMTWEEANRRCQTAGEYRAYLAMIKSEEENEFVKGLLMPYVKANKMNGFWLGAKRSGSGWKWNDGTPVTFFDWHNGQPNNYNGNQNCLEMWWKDGKLAWADQDCGIAPWTAICMQHYFVPI